MGKRRAAIDVQVKSTQQLEAKSIKSQIFQSQNNFSFLKETKNN